MTRNEGEKNITEGRVRRLREGLLALPEVCVERGYLWTESYKETENEPPIIRRAKALSKVLREMSVHIEDEELIVGRATSKRRGGALLPEIGLSWLLSEMDTLSTRDWDRFAPLKEEEKAKIRDFLPYWKNKTLYEKWQATIPDSALKLHNKVAALGCYCGGNQHFSHAAPDYEMILNLGLIGVKKNAEAELEKLNLAVIKDFDKYLFLNAVIITLDAVISFATRYANLANRLAEQELRTQRKNELEKIAYICKQVPANPAGTFHEALQSIWFIYAILMIEGWGNGIAFGRADQYLYSFYKSDLADGRTTVDEARELIALLYIKINELVIVHGSESVRFAGGFPNWADITLGGLRPDGQNAVNELSYLFLEAEKDVRLSAEEIIIRVHKKTPDAFLIKACEITNLLKGKLKFVSDETAIQQLLIDGKPIDYARNYILVGCETPTVGGYSHDIPGGLFNLPFALELALNNGASRLTGEQLGPKTGDPRKFQSYQEVYDAYKKQVEALIPVLILFKNVDKQLYADLAPTPFQSAFFHGCIERGLDVTNGGTAPYLTRAIAIGAAPNVGDSLAAIKKVVFEDKKLSMEQLIDALDKNFEGKENILHLLQGAPKFGNDDDYVDSIVNDVLVHARDEAARYKGIAGAISNVAAGLGSANIPSGYVVGALPDGRRAGEPLSEGGISPYQGRNVSGPTATMRSISKLDLVKLTNGCVLNMRFNSDVMKDVTKIRKFATLIRTFCESGGYLVQFNIVSSDTLRAAQRDPDQYKDLLVRVATYSARFVELSPELQNDIIARIEFQEL